MGWGFRFPSFSRELLIVYFFMPRDYRGQRFIERWAFSGSSERISFFCSSFIFFYCLLLYFLCELSYMRISSLSLLLSVWAFIYRESHVSFSRYWLHRRRRETSWDVLLYEYFPSSSSPCFLLLLLLLLYFFWERFLLLSEISLQLRALPFLESLSRVVRFPDILRRLRFGL